MPEKKGGKIMVFYKNLESRSIEGILLHASNDVENWSEEERSSLRTIAEGVKKFKSLQNPFRVFAKLSARSLYVS